MRDFVTSTSPKSEMDDETEHVINRWKFGAANLLIRRSAADRSIVASNVWDSEAHSVCQKTYGGLGQRPPAAHFSFPTTYNAIVDPKDARNTINVESVLKPGQANCPPSEAPIPARTFGFGREATARRASMCILSVRGLRLVERRRAGEPT